MVDILHPIDDPFSFSERKVPFDPRRSFEPSREFIQNTVSIEATENVPRICCSN